MQLALKRYLAAAGLYGWAVRTTRRHRLSVAFSADQGKIGLRRNDVNLDNLRYTYSAGLTVRAGGLPVVDPVTRNTNTGTQQVDNDPRHRQR